MKVFDGTDKQILEELGERVREFRLGRNISQAALASQAGISLRSLIRLEAGENPTLASFIRVLRFFRLSENLDLLVPDPDDSPLQEIPGRQSRRQRASGRAETGRRGL